MPTEEEARAPAPAPRPAAGPLRVGVVGLGRRGRLHAATLQRLRPEGVVLIALVDLDPAALASSRLLFPGVPTFADVEKALASSSAEAWVCATPCASHAPLCKVLLAAGRTVLVESPLADELAAAESLEMYVDTGAGGAGQGRLMVGHAGIFEPRFRNLRHSAAGKGPLSLIACEQHLPAAALDPARVRRDRRPGTLFDAVVGDWAAKLRALVGGAEPAVFRASSFKGHDVAVYGATPEESCVSPRPVAAYPARELKRPLPQEHLGCAQLLFEDGLVATITCSRLLPDGAAPSSRLRLFGRGWCASCEGGDSAHIVADQVVPTVPEPTPTPPADDGLGAVGPLADELRCFARFAGRSGHAPPPGTSFEDGVAVVRWLEAMKAAATATHRALPLSLLSAPGFVDGADAPPPSWRDSTEVGRREYRHPVHGAPQSRALPVTVLTAPQTGPTVLVLAGLGGDEAEGMAAVQHVLAGLQTEGEEGESVLARRAPPNPKPFRHPCPACSTWGCRRGRVVAVACCNMDAYDLGRASRFSPSDGLDLARAFPGRHEGSLTARVAHTITTEFLASADFVATVHSGGGEGSFQLAPVAGFLAPANDKMKAADGSQAARLAQQHAAATACAMTAVWAPAKAAGSVQEAAAVLGVPSVFLAASGALGGGAHGAKHDALGLSAGLRHLLVHLSLLPPHEQPHAQLLQELELERAPPRKLGAAVEGAEAVTRPAGAPVPAALLAAMPMPFGDGVGAVVATAKGMWRPRAHCGDVGAQQSNTRPGCLFALLTPCRPQSSLVRSWATCWTCLAA